MPPALDGELLGLGSPSPSLLFRERDGGWTGLPSWVSYFIQLGLAWPTDRTVKRLCFVSTPCDSVGAALIALGTLLTRMLVEGSDDLSTHFGRLNALVPGRHDRVIRHRPSPSRRFEVYDRTPTGDLRFRECVDGGQVWHLLKANSTDWYFDGEPPVELSGGESLPHAGLYRALVGAPTALRERNLSTTDSAIVLAGRPMGRTATENLVAAVLFKYGADEATLKDLLAIHGWQSRNVSRMRYFNPRLAAGSRFDRGGPSPQLIVADGLQAFQAARAEPACAEASVITVVPRCGDPQELEEAGEALMALSQWFEAVPGGDHEFPSAPAGVATVVLKARS